MDLRDRNAPPAIPGAPCNVMTIVVGGDNRVCDELLRTGGFIRLNRVGGQFLVCDAGHEVWEHGYPRRDLGGEL